MSDKIFDASTDFSMLQPCTAMNNIMGFETMALRVTEKNLVHLSLILESEVRARTNDSYCVAFRAKRQGNVASGFKMLSVSPGEWIVILDGELRVLPDELFKHAFTTDELVEYRCTICGKISGDNKDGSYGEKHATIVVGGGGVILPSSLSRLHVLVDCNMDLKV